jgi:hypothetical protein
MLSYLGTISLSIIGENNFLFGLPISPKFQKEKHYCCNHKFLTSIRSHFPRIGEIEQS